MNRSALFLGLIGVLAAPAAWAVTAQTGVWLDSCQTGKTAAGLTGGEWACYRPASGMALDAATPALSVASCDNIDIQHLDDWDGDGTASTVTWQPQMCSPFNSANTDTIRNLSCNSMVGVAALTGDDARSKLAGFYVRFVGGGAGANIASSMLIVKCALGTGGAP